MVVKKIAILFSGSGTNLENILEKLHNKTYKGTKLEVVLTICNKMDAKGVQRSLKYGITPLMLLHEEFNSREEFDLKLVSAIKEHDVDLAVLAGFMRILTPVFTKNVQSINIHPSLLPLFKGANGIKDSYHSDEKRGGATVHMVNEELDGGEIVLQKSFLKTKQMSLQEFEQKVHEIEYEIFPEAIIKILCK